MPLVLCHDELALHIGQRSPSPGQPSATLTLLTMEVDRNLGIMQLLRAIKGIINAM
jgi:hypothetical protein